MSYQTDIGRGDTNGAGKQAAAELKESISTLREDASKLGNVLKSAAKEQFAQQRDKLEGATSEVADRAQTIFSRLEEQIRARPAAALGISLGAGFLLAMLMRGRN